MCRHCARCCGYNGGKQISVYLPGSLHSGCTVGSMEEFLQLSPSPRGSHWTGPGWGPAISTSGARLWGTSSAAGLRTPGPKSWARCKRMEVRTVRTAALGADSKAWRGQWDDPVSETVFPSQPAFSEYHAHHSWGMAVSMCAHQNFVGQLLLMSLRRHLLILALRMWCLPGTRPSTVHLRLLWSQKKKKKGYDCIALGWPTILVCLASPNSGVSQDVGLSEAKARKVLDELIGLVLLLNVDTKRRIHKRKIWKIGPHQIKNFCFVKDYVKRVRR